MDLIASIPFKFLLPVILLGLQFSLKVFIDRRATAFNFVTSILEFPINIFFLALSLLAGFIIVGPGDIQKAFMTFVGILCLLIFCIFFWRRSVEYFEQRSFWKSLGLGILNLFLSIPVLIYIIYFLMNNDK